MFNKFILLLVVLMISCSKDDPPVIEGCIDILACNHNTDATEDDGSCSYAEENYDCDGNCLAEVDECGECGGDGPQENYDCDGNCLAGVDECGECGGSGIIYQCDDGSEFCSTHVCSDFPSNNISIINQSELWYNIDEDIAGFQLTIYGKEVVISDITLDYPEFDVYYDENSLTILVFSSTSFGASIPSGCGILLNIIYTGEITDVDVTFVNWDEEEMEITYQNCFSN